MNYLNIYKQERQQRVICFNPVGTTFTSWDSTLHLFDSFLEIGHVNYQEYSKISYRPFVTIVEFSKNVL